MLADPPRAVKATRLNAPGRQSTRVKNLILFVVSTSRSLEGREHGVATEVYNQHPDLEQVRALLGHTGIETTEVYAQCRGRRIMRDLRRSRWGIASGRRAPWYRRRRPPASLPTAPCRSA